jgi:hypothetical protein
MCRRAAPCRAATTVLTARVERLPIVSKKVRPMRSTMLGMLSFLACQTVTSVCFADNPIVQTMFTADPAPLVHEGVLYVYTGHDEDGAGWFDMREWRLFSTTDMVNWTDSEPELTRSVLGSPRRTAERSNSTSTVRRVR